jgi:hypothetical protein
LDDFRSSRARGHRRGLGSRDLSRISSTLVFRRVEQTPALSVQTLRLPICPPALEAASLFCTSRLESASFAPLSKGAGRQQWLIGEDRNQRRSHCHRRSPAGRWSYYRRPFHWVILSSK